MQHPCRTILWLPATAARQHLPGTVWQARDEPAWPAADRADCGCRAGGWRCTPSRSSPTWAPGGAAATASPATAATTPRTRCPPPRRAMALVSDCGCKAGSRPRHTFRTSCTPSSQHLFARAARAACRCGRWSGMQPPASSRWSPRSSCPGTAAQRWRHTPT